VPLNLPAMTFRMLLNFFSALKKQSRDDKGIV
jgi:hypothetical protein